MAREKIQDEMRVINNELRKQKLKCFLSAMKHLDVEKAFVSYNKASDKLSEAVENIQDKNIYALPKMMSELRNNCEFQMKISNQILSEFSHQEYAQEYHWGEMGLDDRPLEPIGLEDVGFIEYIEEKEKK